jgi:hypothetical protein
MVKLEAGCQVVGTVVRVPNAGETAGMLRVPGRGDYLVRGHVFASGEWQVGAVAVGHLVAARDGGLIVGQLTRHSAGS